MSLRRPLSVIFVVALAAMVTAWACVPADTRPTPGSLTLTVSPSLAVDKGVVTADGWTITFDRVLLGMGNVTMSDDCTEYGEANYDRVVDVTHQSGQKLGIIHGLGSCDVRFRMGAPSDQAVLGAGVSDDDKTRLRTPGADPYVDAGGIGADVALTATRGGVTKHFELQFRPRVRYGNCHLDADASAVVFQGSVDQTYDVRIEGEALFRDSADASTASLVFDPFAAADLDGDGVVTLNELSAVQLDTIRDGGAFEAGTYDFDDDAGVIRIGKPILVSTLADYVYLVLAPSLPRFRDVGNCTPGVGRRGGGGGGFQ